MQTVIAAYATNDALYQNCLNKMTDSCKRFAVPHITRTVTTSGIWNKNAQYKSQFLLDLVQLNKGKCFAYLDADATVEAPPTLFDTIVEDLGVHVLDHRANGHNRESELISAAIFFRANDRVENLFKLWVNICLDNPTLWDQKALAQALLQISVSVFPLPQTYCQIFDYRYKTKTAPVILQHQISRQARKIMQVT